MNAPSILAADVLADHSIWLDAWNASGSREPFAHPVYTALFARPEERALAAHWRSDSGGILFPFIARPLSTLPWAKDELGWDLVSPYGYGGAYAWGDGVNRAKEFWQEFEAWAATHGVVTSFTRLSLFPEQILAPPVEPDVLFPNVVRSLDLDSEAMWRDYEHKVRKNVNKARRAGLRVEHDEGGAHLGEFLEIYSSTMDRRSAGGDYYFPETFFQTIVEQMPGSFVFFHVLSGDRIVSTELVLISRDHLYSYLGGTLADAFDLRPNDLLKHEVIEWGRARGSRDFVLGGGYGAADGIFRYKRSFAPSGEVPFRVAKQTYDPDAVTRLVSARARAHASTGTAWEPRAGFFPPYRS